MRSNSKIVIDKIQAYIKDSLLTQKEINLQYNEGYTPLTVVEMEFTHWYNKYNQDKFPNKQEAFSDWLRGVPSCFNIDYGTYNIKKVVESWSINKPKRKVSDDDTLKLFHYLIYREFSKMLKKEGKK